MPRVKKGRNMDGTGGFEVLPSGLIRHHRMVDGKRLKGPARETREEAREAWEAQHLSPEPEESTPSVVLGLYVHSLCNRENGTLKGEEAETTISLLRSIYNCHLQKHPDAQKLLSEWTPKMAREWAKGVKVAPVTLERYIAAMKMVFRRASQDGLCASNPFENVRAPRRPKESEKTVLPRQEQKAMLASLEGRTKDAAVLWLHGLRRGEAAGLRFEDFDGEGVTIRRQIVETDLGIVVVDMTKNRRPRWVPLDKDGLDLMRRQKSGWVLPAKTNRKSKEGDEIRKRFGSMCARPHNIYRDLMKALTGTPWDGTHPHDYRSSAGTDLMRTTDLRTAAEIMGHDPKVLVGTYSRSDKVAKKKAMEGRG